MATPVNIAVINESTLASQTQVGKILFTETGKNFIIKSDGSKLQITDVISVSTLPSVGITNKLYVLTSDYSINIFDTSWHKISGGSGGSNQIVIGTTNTDTTKLWLDTSTTNPILKYHNGTSWVNISGSSVVVIDDTNVSATSTYSSNKIVSLINNQGDYNTTYSYNGDGKISGYTITGDIAETVSYTYFSSGDNIGKIETETIVKNGKTLVNTFSYTNGKISGVTTVTN